MSEAKELINFVNIGKCLIYPLDYLTTRLNRPLKQTE